MAIAKLLVANRGEIAARIFRTCDRLGIETVAVVAPDEPNAFHARHAGEVQAVRGYLSAEDLIDAATHAGASAVHPGYGFLAENADFAAAVQAAGLTWIGPPPEAIRLAGDKVNAKRIAAEAGAPCLGSGSAAELGFPLLVKAAAGGGGRGMRVVRSQAELDDALASASREAASAFGDGTVFLERYLEHPRHVEVQLLADRHGSIAAVGERDCSIQRRHQKLLEESPSPGIDDGLRARLEAAAIAFAGAVGYEGAGTVEFLVHEERFYFLELNARIQVEHPVTELVTGLDLVEAQIRLACGEPLPAIPRRSGHAVEVRLYAEDPVAFRPQVGRLEELSFPDGIRVDAGIAAGDEVPIAYDALLAKLIAHGPDRATALDRLAGALAGTVVRGVTTNLGFLRWLVAHPAVRSGETSTSFLDLHRPLSREPRVTGPWRGYWRLNRDPSLPLPAWRPLDADEARPGATAGADGDATVSSPTPGIVVRVLVAEGDEVEARQPLVILEAMKMETPIASPYPAIVSRVHVAEGHRVAGGDVLVELGPRG